MKSLRSALVVASVLWTAGLLLFMHMLTMLLVHVFPSLRGVHSWLAVIAALLLMLAGVLSARRTLTMFADLRGKLATVRQGQERRVEGAYPAEVQPLIDDLNGLLEDREKAVKRAFATAGDLAHGLKTPLALLAQEAARTEAAGNPELAHNIAQQVDRMSRHVNYHLARARAAASGASGAAPCLVAPRAGALVRTLRKLHAARCLEIAATLSPELAVRVQSEDLDEILGNLLDNACKWAESKVVLSAAPSGAELHLIVDDDGPGLAPEQRTVVLERGVRLDQAAPGSGLGLAIVGDLVELYGGAIRLEDAPPRGLRARVILPAG